MKKFSIFNLLILAFSLTTFTFVNAQTEMPKPSAPRSVKIPLVTERKLVNGMKVAVVQRKNVPLVTIQFLVKSGASMEDFEKAGLANMTASLLTKGTKTRTAIQIAEEMEFLGGSINSGAGWNNSVVTINVMADKLDAAMAILSDVLLNPKFEQSEIDLLKSQIQDGLAYNLKQPGFLANYVASKYSFDEHPAGGTPESITAIVRDDIVEFKERFYTSDNSVLIFSGDISAVRANAVTQKYFGKWKKPKPIKPTVIEKIATMEKTLEPPKDLVGIQQNTKPSVVSRILVVDLPDSGQASVNFAKSGYTGRIDYDGKNRFISNPDYFTALVLNSVLGGGYSSRLNQEIRIKRGLSYGAGSGFGWRSGYSNFITRTQTKNESAAEVAELVVAELEKLAVSDIAQTELAPRKLVLTGDFGRDLETSQGLAQRLAEIYSFDLPVANLTTYIKNVNAVKGTQIKTFAKENFVYGDFIIVGDYAKFKDDLANRFPNTKIEIIKADELDLSKENLKK